MNIDMYNFEVRFDNGFKAREYYHQGQTYIEGRKSSQYNLFFENRSGRRVLVVPSVDGLSILDGKPAGVKSRGYVVDAFSYVTIPGWTLDSNKVARFEFQPTGDSRNLTYVESLKADGIDADTMNIGVIGCMVFTEKYVPDININSLVYNNARGIPISTRGYETRRIVKGIAPSGATFSANASSPATMDFMGGSDEPVASASVGTGFGQDHSFRTTQVSFTRATPETPQAVFLVTYDTLQGLRKRGVPVDPKPTPMQQAFPATVPTEQGCYVPRNRNR